MSAIQQAEKQIAAILARLETETGDLVESIEVRDMDLTQIQDDRQQLLRSVSIEMRRPPGGRWAQVDE